MTTSLATAVPAGTYNIDPVHSRVGFAVRHLGIATVRGHFGSFEGSFEIGDDVSSARVHGSVEAASVNTQEPQRDDDLRSPNFFDVERFPSIEFSSKEIRPLDSDRFEVVGDLTLHGVTRELTLSAEILGTESDPWGNERIGLEVTGRLSRSDYGMKLQQTLGSGNLVVGDKVTLALDLSATKHV